MKKRIVTLAMAAVLVLGTSTTFFAANSPIVNNSPIVDNTQTPDTKPSDEIKDELAQITEAEEKKEYLETLPKKDLVLALQNDKELLEQVKEVEAEYAKKLNIEVKPAKVDEKVKNIVKADSIKIVGAALNAGANETVEFAVSEPETKVEVASIYHNAVQLDLKLFIDGVSKSELDVPVTITMEAPEGVSTSNLVILHYHDGATTPDVITPVVNEDGTITFAVSGFSTFVFANTVDSSYYYYIASPYGDTVNAKKAPKTGETANVASVMAVLSMAAAATVIVRRKATVK